MAVLTTGLFELPHHRWRRASAATAASRAIDPADTALRITALDRHRSSAGLAWLVLEQ